MVLQYTDAALQRCRPVKLTPPTIEIVGFLGGAARFVTKPCLNSELCGFQLYATGVVHDERPAKRMTNILVCIHNTRGTGRNYRPLWCYVFCSQNVRQSIGKHYPRISSFQGRSSMPWHRFIFPSASMCQWSCSSHSGLLP